MKARKTALMLQAKFRFSSYSMSGRGQSPALRIGLLFAILLS